VQYAVSTKAAEANDPHRYDEIKDEPGVSNYDYCTLMYSVLIKIQH